QPIFFYHFVGGMTLGYLYNKHGSSISLLNKLFLKNFSIGSTVLFIGLFVFAHIPMQFLNSFFRQILLTVPYTIIVGILLVPETILTRIFSSKLLVYIGTISYSIYLSHIWITHVTLQVLGHPATAVQAIVYIVIAFSLCLLFASTLYFLLERPYFMRAKAKKKRMTDFSYVPGNKALFICFSICAIYLVTTFFAYKINLTYNLLHDPHWRSVAVSTRISKADSAFMANEKLQVAEERKKTLIMLLPFFTLVCYFLYSGINKTKFVPRRA
ncbi:MAG TPA: hypothetical protein VEP90_23855, partial [Methylomirabilota bacterium]|nr:hypothetical protein [Methylomirabilota bacterium]